MKIRTLLPGELRGPVDVTALLPSLAASLAPLHDWQRDLDAVFRPFRDQEQWLTRELEGVLSANQVAMGQIDRVLESFRPSVGLPQLDIARLLPPDYPDLSELAGGFFRQLAADTFGSSEVARLLAQLERETDLLSRVRVTSGGVRVDGSLVSRVEARAAFAHEMAFVADVPREHRLVALLQHLLAQAKDATKRPMIAALLAVFGVLLLMVAEGEVQFYSAELFQPVRQHVIRQIRGRLQDTAPVGSDVRLVRANRLAVRNAPRQNRSTVITRVSFPTLVIVLREKKDWTLIAYEDDDAVVQGWVFTRYLTKVTTPRPRH